MSATEWKQQEGTEASRFISTEQIRGTDIFNQAGDYIGRIEYLMIDKESGKVAFAIVQFGGFLGIGSKRRALPWSVLSYQRALNRYIVDAEDDVIRKTPGFLGDEDYLDPNWVKILHQHYKIAGTKG